MHLRIRVVLFNISCQGTAKDFDSQQLHIDEWQREVFVVDDAKHVKPFRAEDSELLVLMVYPVELFLEVQELLDTVIFNNLPRSESESDGDLEHSA